MCSSVLNGYVQVNPVWACFQSCVVRLVMKSLVDTESVLCSYKCCSCFSTKVSHVLHILCMSKLYVVYQMMAWSVWIKMKDKEGIAALVGLPLSAHHRQHLSMLADFYYQIMVFGKGLVAFLYNFVFIFLCTTMLVTGEAQ